MIKLPKQNDEPLFTLNQVERMLRDLGKSLRPVEVIRVDGDSRHLLRIIGYHQTAKGVVIEVYEQMP